MLKHLLDEGHGAIRAVKIAVKQIMIEQKASLPKLKRISLQTSMTTGLPVALVARIDARQRKALVAQGIPFIVPDRQAFLPMLGFATTARRDLPSLAETLAPSV